MPVQKPQSEQLLPINIPNEDSTGECRQWAHLVEKEGMSLEKAAQDHKVALGVLLQLNPQLGPQNKLLSPFHDLVLLPKNFNKVDGADICIRDGDGDLLTYSNRRYIPSFVIETVSQWRQKILDQFSDPKLKQSFKFELTTRGPNYLTFSVDEMQSKAVNLQRKNTSFQFSVESSASGQDTDGEVRAAFRLISREMASLISISKIESSGKKTTVTFTLANK